MEHARELLNKYNNENERYYNIAPVQTQIFSLEAKLKHSFSANQLEAFNKLIVCMEQEKRLNDVHLVEFVLNYVREHERH